MTKTTHNRECKLHAQPSGENIMILELENWAKGCAYFGIKNIWCLTSLGYTILSVSNCGLQMDRKYSIFRNNCYLRRLYHFVEK